MSSSSWWAGVFDATALPLFAVWLAGMFVAVLRWGRHPRVSALVAASLAGMLMIYVSQRLVSRYIIINTRGGGQSLESMSIYLGLLSLAASLFRAGAWAGILVAVFGWRGSPSRAGAAPFQFSIRALMIITLAVALLCGLVRGLITWLGESAMILLNLVDDIPVIVCWVVGIRVALVRWPMHPAASKCALFGIWINLIVLVIVQALWITLVVTQSPVSIRLFLYLPITLVSAVAWVLLLIAAFGWRDEVESQARDSTTSPAPPLAG